MNSNEITVKTMFTDLYGYILYKDIYTFRLMNDNFRILKNNMKLYSESEYKAMYNYIGLYSDLISRIRHYINLSGYYIECDTIDIDSYSYINKITLLSAADNSVVFQYLLFPETYKTVQGNFKFHDNDSYGQIEPDKQILTGNYHIV